MNIKEVTRQIAEEMNEKEINAVVLALVAGFDRVHPEGEMICLALPKFDQVERKRLLESTYRMILEETYDKETGKAIENEF